MKTAEEGKYLFVKNINNKYIDGILDNETMLLLCACTEENADIIIKALNYNQKMEEVIPKLLEKWEQFKRGNWFESEAIDVEKLLIWKFTSLLTQEEK